MRSFGPHRLLITAALVFAVGVTLAAQRRDVFVQSRLHAAIGYDTHVADDPIARVNKRLADGTLTLQYEEGTGYLKSALAALRLPLESQSLVFSQTSFQAELINVRTPRAIYFNPTTALGYVRGGELLEVAAHDPTHGVIFYELRQQQSAAPRFVRNDNCLACHLSWDTLGVPGLVAQSVHPLPDMNSYVNGYQTNHASPYEERWGGWFVTGAPARLRHMGNVPVMPVDKGKLKLANTNALGSVENLVEPGGYLSPFSDVAALMTLAHQVGMTNRLTRVGWEARLAAAAPGADARGRVQEAARDLVDYMLFVDEPSLPAPVQSPAGFATMFAAQGPRDSKGRSLYDLDLRTRLLRYPCSYMIYSEAFDALPPMAKDAVFARLGAILTGVEKAPRYTPLKAADRQAILEILRETRKDLPAALLQ